MAKIRGGGSQIMIAEDQRHPFAEVNLEIDPVLYHVVAFVVQMLSKQVIRLKMNVHRR